MSLLITLATRGRPERLIETLRASLPNMARDDTRIVVAIDDDDEATLKAIPNLPRDHRLITDVRPREDALGAKWNRGWLYHGPAEVYSAAPATVYAIMTDYSVWITPHFDQKMLDAARLFPDGIGVVYTHMA